MKRSSLVVLLVVALLVSFTSMAMAKGSIYDQVKKSGKLRIGQSSPTCLLDKTTLNRRMKHAVASVNHGSQGSLVSDDADHVISSGARTNVNTQNAAAIARIR